MRVRIVTDSTADLLPGWIAEEGITVVPVYVRFGEEVYRDDVEISREDFYRRLRAGGVLPQTAAPSAGDFEIVYRQLREEADVILSIHVASAFSAVCNAAHLAAQNVSRPQVYVFDSGQVSMGLGWQARYAARWAREGLSPEEILRHLQALRPRVRLLATVEDVNYLHRSGRIDWIRAFTAALLHLKPLIEVYEGQAMLRERVRRWHRAVERLGEIAAQRTDLEALAILHADPRDAARDVARRLQERWRIEIPILQACPAIGAHVGPGAVGIAWVER
ncbi:DegV family protein [Thermoflexus sp.]|uniref:DegV family protein n=1 Tax=Thermoflexus sp. TaxID=1969742 RepID=UPI0025E40A67|nr:DegV family protein [Thermoflexus sp.]MCS6962881.1 DegV family protein [Thermoflexus sp.]MCS7351359.1 DegV family protein [Thermoflexus sp.]MCX7690112.1 DegV family protein [Thermoflexus sp.]MDW8180814.1 DegV family protein [Anaerolineae bacterium]